MGPNQIKKAREDGLNRPHTGILAAGAVAAALAIATPASAQIYSLGTGKQGFFSYSAGAAIA